MNSQPGKQGIVQFNAGKEAELELKEGTVKQNVGKEERVKLMHDSKEQLG